MQTKTRTLVLAITVAVVGTAATLGGVSTAMVTDLNSGDKFATTIGKEAEVDFSYLDPSIVTEINEEEAALKRLAEFFGPESKDVVVRYYDDYEWLKKMALEHGVTTPQRIAETTVIPVADMANMYGINDIDAYAAANKLISTDEYPIRNLAYEAALLDAVKKDIDAKARTGELKRITD